VKPDGLVVGDSTKLVFEALGVNSIVIKSDGIKLTGTGLLEGEYQALCLVLHQNVIILSFDLITLFVELPA